MRCLKISGVITFLLVLSAIPSMAQWQRNIPPGDYVQTCRNIRTYGNTLQAECQKRDGGWRRTSMDNLNQCGGGIINNNGRLQCGGGNGYGYGYPGRDRDQDNDRGYRGRWQGNLPPGDYVQTCRNITTNGNHLDAECQKRDGNWRRTGLNDLYRCNGPIANDDGHLVCGR